MRLRSGRLCQQQAPPPISSEAPVPRHSFTLRSGRRVRRAAPQAPSGDEPQVSAAAPHDPALSDQPQQPAATTAPTLLDALPEHLLGEIFQWLQPSSKKAFFQTSKGIWHSHSVQVR